MAELYSEPRHQLPGQGPSLSCAVSEGLRVHIPYSSVTLTPRVTPIPAALQNFDLGEGGHRAESVVVRQGVRGPASLIV